MALGNGDGLEKSAGNEALCWHQVKNDAAPTPHCFFIRGDSPTRSAYHVVSQPVSKPAYRDELGVRSYRLLERTVASCVPKS